MLQPDSVMNRQSVKALLQRSLLANVTEPYSLLIAQLQRSWTSTNTNLSEACLSIKRYVFSSTEAKALYTASTNTTGRNAPYKRQAPEGSCDFEECVARNKTSHYKDKCFRKNPSLRPKWMLNKMRTKSTVGSVKTSTGTINATSGIQQTPAVPALSPPDVTS